jgi:SAM-dependent methyltransferase
MNKIDVKEVIEKYNSINIIWSKEDKWHYWTHRMIRQFITNVFRKIALKSDTKILNAGSAGYSYELPEKNILHIDIASEKIKHLQNSIVGSIEKLPFFGEQFDYIICVGSVLNYCDPIKVMQEFNGVLKKGGNIILEYENSNTLELFGTANFNKKAVLTDTFYYGDETIWFFSDLFINEILANYGMRITKRKRCHILSPLIYRFTKRERLSAVFGYFDFLLRWLPVSSNTIVLIEKKL